MTTHSNLAAALVAFQAEMPSVAKSKRAEVPTKTGGKYTYTYADLAGVTEIVMPLLTSHGLSFVSAPQSSPQGYELRGILLHESGEELSGALPIKGATPQEIGSSLTYMRRYLLGCLTGIVTDDDDDGSKTSKAPKTRDPDSAPAATRPMSRPARADDATDNGITKAQSAALHASFNGAGITDRELRLSYCRNLIGRDIGTSSELSKGEASQIIDALKADSEGQS